MVLGIGISIQRRFIPIHCREEKAYRSRNTQDLFAVFRCYQIFGKQPEAVPQSEIFFISANI